MNTHTLSDIITISNCGRDIAASTFWQSKFAQSGYLHISINAGAFRLLAPPRMSDAIRDMRQWPKHIVVSMLPRDQWEKGWHCVEWMVGDGSDNPWSCHLSPHQIDRSPLPEDAGKLWVGSVCDWTHGKPHKRLGGNAYLQIVPQLP